VAEPEQSSGAYAETQADRAVVFISYAREDWTFVEHFVEALQLKGLQVCGDWQLVRGENYQDQLDQLLLGSDAVVFVLSPDSVRSAPCRAELERAVEQNRVIFPVVHRDLGQEEKELPPALALPQWTFLRSADDFVGGVQGLEQAINTDFDLMPEHRRLLQAAGNWHRNNRSPSYLLRKESLKSAEDWLAATGQRANKLPKPTPLELDFIRASQTARARRTRITLAATVALAAAMLVLAITAYVQRNEAIQQRNIALARQLAAQAELLLNSDPRLIERAMLLAAESLKRWASTEADQVLRRGLPLLPKVLAEVPHKTEVEGVALTPDGRNLITLSDGGVFIWELSTKAGRPRSTRQPIRVAQEGGILSSGVSPNGEYLVTGGVDKTVRVFELPSGRPLRKMTAEAKVTNILFTPESKYVIVRSSSSVVHGWKISEGTEAARLEHEDVVQSLSLSEDGRLLCTGTRRGAVRVWDWLRQKLLAQFRAQGPVYGVACGPDGLVAAADGTQQVRVWLPNGAQVHMLSHEGKVSQVVLSPDNKLLAAAAENLVQVWDTRLWRAIRSFRHDDLVQTLAFHPREGLLATASLDRTARLWNTTTGQETARVTHEEAVMDIAFDRKGRYLATASNDKSARVVLVLPEESAPPWEASALTAAAYSATGKYLATGDREGTLGVWDVAGRRAVIKIPPSERQVVSRTAFSPDDHYLASADGADSRGRVRIVDLQAGGPVSRLEHGARISALAFSPESRQLATGGEDHMVRLWTVGARLMTALEQPDEVIAIAYSPDGRSLAAAVGSFGRTHRNGFVVWDLTTRTTTVSIEGQSAPTAAVSFSHDGRYLVVAGQDFAAHVWDLREKREVGPPLRHDLTVWSAAFSSDPKHLVTGSEDKSARVWDWATGRELARLPHQDAVKLVAFSPDGGQVLTASFTQSGEVMRLRFWLWQPGDMIQQVCSRVGGRLSREEWSRYLGNEPFQPVCSL
jgi:WD40 repeat protein